LKIKQRLRCPPVVHADEIGLRVMKKCQYVHEARTSRLTHYRMVERRGRLGIDVGILL
jgi:hypothetical protein